MGTGRPLTPSAFRTVLICDVLRDLLDTLFIARNRLTDGNRQKITCRTHCGSTADALAVCTVEDVI